MEWNVRGDWGYMANTLVHAPLIVSSNSSFRLSSYQADCDDKFNDPTLGHLLEASHRQFRNYQSDHNDRFRWGFAPARFFWILRYSDEISTDNFVQFSEVGEVGDVGYQPHRHGLLGML